MNNDIKNFFLAGLGSAAYTFEKATNLIDDFVQKGKLTLDEGKCLSEELKRTVKEKKEEEITLTKDKNTLTKEDMILLLKDMNFATKEDIENVNQRLKNLEISHS
ncbi:phasin family protein [Clostridium estertheticum]|uniref:phasin family protein n=1 Tax=Clostridium estertheticum TaxID=238834 RepID=UPI001C7D3034|nr:hypothetical protein [Clostridium estertheticum]MBX4267475.1 hypothetical protein [Clostridium estertheticum]WLC87839.1 hypothetical protein KTC95_17395 [Clostridium estertheticum]